MKTIKAIYDNETKFIEDIVFNFINCYIELYNYDTSKTKGKIRVMQERFGTKNYPLIILEDENLIEYNAVFSESNPDWKKEILQKINE